MSSDRFDVVVIGAGHNGLVCACYLARAGLSVCVLERRPHVGGAAVTEEFAPGFRNSAASYTVSLLRQQIVDDLALLEHGLRIVPRPLANFVPSLEGAGLALPSELTAAQSSIAAHSQKDADNFPLFVHELSRLTAFFNSLMLEPPVDLASGWPEYSRLAKQLLRLRKLRREDWGSLWTMLTGSAGDWLDRWFECDTLKAALGFDSVVGHFASPYQSGSGYLLLHHALGDLRSLDGAWGHAIGGMGAISDALAAQARRLGVVIHCETSVDGIDVYRQLLTVRAGDKAYPAKAVVGSIHPKLLFMQFLDRALLPPDFVRRISAYRSESASFRANVALSELPDFSCLPGLRSGVHHAAGIIIAPSLQYLDSAYRDAYSTGMSSDPVIELVIPSTLDDSLAPPGTHVASLFCQHFRYSLPEGHRWSEQRDAALERIIDTVDRYAPNFRRSILAATAYSPVDLEREFGLVGGDIFHGELSLDQLYWARPVWGFAQYRTPVNGVYLAGSGAHPGGGVSGAPGFNAARTVIADFRSRRIGPST